jgi:ankyrin repeat protein
MRCNVCVLACACAVPEDVRVQMRSYMLLRFNAAEEHREVRRRQRGSTCSRTEENLCPSHPSLHFTHAQVLDAFPLVLRARVSRLLHLPVLAASPLLAGCGHGFVDALACHVSVELFMPGVTVLCQFDASLELFFIASGTAEVLALEEVAEPEDEDFGDERDGGGGGDAEAEAHVLLETIGEGASFGEVPFLFHQPQPFTVRTRTLCRVLCLKRDAWTAAEAAHPRDARIAAHAVMAALTAAAASAASRGPAGGALRRGILEPLAAAVAAVMAARDAERVGELCLAAARDDVLSIRRAIAAGAGASAADYDGRTALHVAAAKGAHAAVRYLLDHGAAMNAIDAFGNTPLFEAVLGAHATCAAMLRASGAVLGLRDARDDGGGNGDAGVSAAAAVRRGRDAGTLMCSVASSGDVALLSALLTNGLPAGAADYDARTGLHLCAALGRTQALSLLLDAGADASAMDNFGRTPLLEAVRAGHEACVLLLLRHGAQLGLHTGASASAAPGALLAGGEMCQAAFAGDVDYLRRLLRAGCLPDAKDYDARTAAHLACAEGLFPAALALHAAGADFSARDRWGHTPLDEADAAGHGQMAHILRSMPPPRLAAPPGGGAAAVMPHAAGGAGSGDGGGTAATDAQERCSSADEDADEAESVPGSAGSLEAGMAYAWPPKARRGVGVGNDAAASEAHVEGLPPPPPRTRGKQQPPAAAHEAPRDPAGERDRRSNDPVGSWLAAMEPPSPLAPGHTGEAAGE